jgi:outer membrane protein assembly factor BamB
MGKVKGQPMLFLGGADGVCYAMEAMNPAAPRADLARLKTIWKFDCDPSAPKEDVHRFVGNRQESPSEIMGMPVFHEGRIYVTAGGDLWWGKRQGWLKCIDATKTGDITKTGEVWSYPLSRETCCTPAIYDGMVFVADCGGVLHCLDAATGKPFWTHKASGDFWASPLVADGKVYIGTRRGNFVIFAASREKRQIASIDFAEPISGTASAANGVLFVATMSHLYAIAATR